MAWKLAVELISELIDNMLEITNLHASVAGTPETPLPQAGGAGGGRFKPRDTARAKELRNSATPAERALWRALSNRKLSGHKFSRQMPIGHYFADFMCREAKLTIEIDGHSHDVRQEHDRQRDRLITEQGFAVLRFSNDDVLGNLDGVVQAIAAALDERCPPPTPPASGRGVRAKPIAVPVNGARE